MPIREGPKSEESLRREPAWAGPPGPVKGRETLAEAHRRYRLRLERVAARILGSRADAEDVVQRLFLRLPTAGFEGRSSLGTYLHRATVNGALNLLRARRRRQALRERIERLRLSEVSSTAGCNPEQKLLQGELLAAVAQALLEIRPEYRKALLLHAVWGLGNREIARREGVPPATVGTWLRRGREALRRRLAPVLRELEEELR